MARLSEAEHMAQPWRVHDLLPDYRVEDVWAVPVRLRSGDDLATFWEQMQLGLREMGPLSPAVILLRIRLGIGRLLGWDAASGHGGARPLRRRYHEAAGTAPTATDESASSGFTTVYHLQGEYLAEIENMTVEAALHLGRSANGGVNLAVYVKPRGRWGRLYMILIKPLRRWIVYPAILRAAARRWGVYVASTPGAK